MRLTRESQSIQEDAARHVDYAYDLAGNVLTLGYPGGTAVTTSFDAFNRRDAIAKDASPVASYGYVGQRVHSLIFETGANDITQRHHYDGAMRLTRLSQMRDGEDLASFNYTFNAADNITNKVFTHRLGNPSESYGYDTLHRLTHTVFGQRAGTPYEGFVYDDLGNHLTQDHNGTTVASLFNSVNEQTKRDGTDVLWDRTGNLTKDDSGQQYFYDRQNLLTRVEDSGNVLIESYQYDALGRRIIADDGTNQRRFYWNDQQMVEETNGSNVIERTYVWGNYIDELLIFEDTAGVGGSPSASYYALRHHNFNVVALTDSSGAIAERYDYNPYGKRFVLNPDFSDDADDESNYGNSIGHQGLFHDAATNFVYNRIRTLHTTLGRFMQRDPLGYVDGLGLYEYVMSSPLMLLDFSGFSIGTALPPSEWKPPAGSSSSKGLGKYVRPVTIARIIIGIVNRIGATLDKNDVTQTFEDGPKQCPSGWDRMLLQKDQVQEYVDVWVIGALANSARGWISNFTYTFYGCCKCPATTQDAWDTGWRIENLGAWREKWYGAINVAYWHERSTRSEGWVCQ